jgi:hypothetical protein
MIALAVTERANMAIFAEQSAPVVYLNGSLLFVAGIAMVQGHFRWNGARAVLVTMTGCITTALGLLRMALPRATQLGSGVTADVVFVALGLAGIALSVQGYAGERTSSGG